MISELDLLLDVARRLEEAGLEYMLTGSMALNHYAQPRMTREIDMVIALLLHDLEILPRVSGDDSISVPKPHVKRFSINPVSTSSIKRA